jgi:cytochrome c oxidase subunit 3
MAEVVAHAPIHESHESHESHVPFDKEFAYASGGKIGMWIFLVTDAMTFGGFLAAYGLLRVKSGSEWPNPTEYLGITLSAFATFILICSSVSMVLALAAGAEKNRKGLVRWLVITILGGVVFLGIQAYEYTHLVHSGVGFSTLLYKGTSVPVASQFGSTFFVVTGFHGMHVFSGVVYLAVILFLALRGRYDNGQVSEVELVGLFWHFVDLVWILVFTFIYLL